MDPALLLRYRLAAADWADLPAVLQARYTARFERETARAAFEAAVEQRDQQRKDLNRIEREEKRRKRNAPGHAQCGIRWYPMNSGWNHCHDCGQALIYTTDPNAPAQVCNRSLRYQPPCPSTTPANATPAAAA